MNTKSFYGLIGATAVAVVVAAVALFGQPRLQSTDQAGQQLFPNLVNDIESLKSIIVRHADETITLYWDGRAWRYREKHNFLADAEKVTATIVQLARAIKVEPKTRMADRYDRLDLGDPAVKDAKSNQVTLLAVDGKAIADVIIGKRKFTLGSREGGTYVRIPGDPQTWLVQGDLAAGGTPRDWLKRELTDIKDAAVKRIAVTHPNGEKIIVAKGDPAEKNYTVENLPKGAQISSPFAADDYGRVLANMTMDDVVPAADKPFPKDKTISAAIEGFTGFQIMIDIFEADAQTWIKIRGIAPLERPEPPVPAGAHVTDLRNDWAKLIADLNAKADGWAFQVPAFTVGALTRHMSDLLKKTEAKPKVSNQPGSDL